MDDQFSNEELLNSALSDDPPEVAEQVTEGQGDNRPRDDQGRFVEKTEEAESPEVKTEAKPAPVEQQESPGVKQLREALERANRRADEMERRFASSQPKAEPPPKPDVFENPDGAISSRVQEALTPLEQRLSSAIETMSKNFVVSQPGGQERLNSAYSALDQAAKTGDPQALAVVQAVKQSMDPYGDIVRWYADREASLNPQAFFQRQLDERLKDEKFKGELLAKLQPAQQEKSAKPVFSVPPSLRSVAAAAPVMDDGGDFSNESLMAATR